MSDQLPWSTVPELVQSAADRFGGAEAVVDGSLRLSYVELAHRIRCAAGAFAELGVAKGDRVAVWAPNSAEWIIAAFGIMTAGGVLVPVNTRFKAGEAADVVSRSGAKAVMVQKGFLGADFSVSRAGLDIPTIELKSDFLANGAPFECAADGVDVSDVIFTSGTTGRPKGAMMNHRQTLRMYEEWATLADLREGDRYLMINPYFHTFGLKAGLVASFLRGATMLPVAVFDVARVVELVAAERITILARPTDVVSLAAHGRRQGQAVDVAGRRDRRRGHPRGIDSPDPRRASLPDSDDRLRVDRGRQRHVVPSR